MGNVLWPVETEKERPSSLRGGPLGLGDPDDRRLRKTERDIIIPRKMRSEAENRCGALVMKSLECAKREGLMVTFRCKEEDKAKDDCIRKWLQNEDFVKEITEDYLNARSYYRRTGKPLKKYQRGKKPLPVVDYEGSDETIK